MNNLTLRQLRYFDALAEHGHFGRAADVCAISQPALSVQIKELEESFGAPLLERTTRRVRLTSFGEDVLVRVREILRSVDELGDMARAAQSGLTGPGAWPEPLLRLGYSGSHHHLQQEQTR